MQVLGLIPAYDESATIESVIRDLVNYLPEVLVVDDGSRDRTAKLAKEAGALVISHHANLGIGSALMTGYRHAISEGIDVIVQQDADGQHDPSYIPEMLSKIESGHDLVVASRYLHPQNREGVPWRDAGIRFYSHLLSLLLSQEVTDATSGFRAIRTRGVLAAHSLPSRHWAIFQTFDFVKSGLRYTEIAARMRPRSSGTSQFSVPTMALYHLRVSRSLIGQLLGARGEPLQGDHEFEKGGAGLDEGRDRPKLSSK